MDPWKCPQGQKREAVAEKLGSKIRKKEKYQDFAREAKNFWNLKMILIYVMIGALERRTRNMEKCLGELNSQERIDIVYTAKID